MRPAEFVGLENWNSVFSNSLVRTTIRNTLYYALLAVPAVLTLGMVLALFLQNVQRAAGPFRVLLYVSHLIPPVVAAIIALFVVHPDFGALNLGLRFFGITPPQWLGDPQLALPTIAVFEVWRGVGFWTLLFLAGLLGLPRELYAAAHLDGANGTQRFLHLTLPLLRPTLLFALVMATIWNLQLFDSVAILTAGGPVNSTTTVVFYIYDSLFAFGNPGFAAALSVLLLLIIMVLALVQLRLLGGRRRV